MCRGEQQCNTMVVPVEGIEPPLLAEHDFESCASTSSATRACAAIYIRRPARSAKRKSGLARSSIRRPPKAPESAFDLLDSFSVRFDILVRGGAPRRRLWRS